MANTILLADLGRALELLKQVDESRLDFAPDAEVSEDIRRAAGINSYPTDSHVKNVKARIDAVISSGDMLEERGASEYVSKIIPACVKLGPPIDDWRASKRVSAVHAMT